MKIVKKYQLIKYPNVVRAFIVTNRNVSNYCKIIFSDNYILMVVAHLIRFSSTAFDQRVGDF